MLVDKEKLRAPHDTSYVRLEEEWEVRYWCDRFGVGEESLRACVLEVGPRVEDVEYKLRDAAKQVFKNTGED